MDLYIPAMPEWARFFNDYIAIKVEQVLSNMPIKTLPDNLSVGQGLYLSSDAPELLKEDAKKLHEEGKIGYIKYE